MDIASMEQLLKQLLGGQCNAESRGANHFGIGNTAREVHDEFDECGNRFGKGLWT